MNDTHEGGCLCGAVRFSVRGYPLIGLICHCRFCQKRLGTAFAAIAWFEEGNVEFSRGMLSEYEHRSDESGRWLKIAFCPTCGTTVSERVEMRPGLRAISAGTFDDPDWFKIERHIWARSKRPWIAIPANVPVFPKAFPGAPKPSSG